MTAAAAATDAVPVRVRVRAPSMPPSTPPMPPGRGAGRPAGSANSRPRQGTDSRPARNRQPAPPRRRAGSSRCTPPPRPPSRARRAGMTTRQGLRPARRSCASGGDGGLASGRVCRRGGTADPGPGPPRVPEHPREGPLPRRRAETRQARPGQAARVEEPSPGAPSRRGKNDEERAHPQGTTRTRRLNGKLRACLRTGQARAKTYLDFPGQNTARRCGDARGPR